MYLQDRKPPAQVFPSLKGVHPAPQGWIEGQATPLIGQVVYRCVIPSARSHTCTPLKETQLQSGAQNVNHTAAVFHALTVHSPHTGSSTMCME